MGEQGGPELAVGGPPAGCSLASRVDGDSVASPPVESTVHPGSWSLPLQAAVLQGSAGAPLPLTPVPTELAKDEHHQRACWGYREQDTGVGELGSIQQETHVMGQDRVALGPVFFVCSAFSAGSLSSHNPELCGFKRSAPKIWVQRGTPPAGMWG